MRNFGYFVPFLHYDLRERKHYISAHFGRSIKQDYLSFGSDIWDIKQNISAKNLDLELISSGTMEGAS